MVNAISEKSKIKLEAEVAAAEAARFAVFGCRSLRVIRWLLRGGGDAEEDGGSEETCGS